MCGIAGMIGEAADRRLVETMTRSIAHRGPDGEGFFEAPGVVLGHRRLSIIDLSPAGAQPMTSADGRFTITFNGEIYNYKELRADLADYPYRSETDTEVILAGWTREGARFLDRMIGMFAFALHDRDTGEVVIVRDRLGIKPLFYTEQGGALFFASEIKAFFAAGVPRRPNERMIGHYLRWGYYDHTPETFFEGIRSLPAGHLLRVKDGHSAVERYWSLPERVEPIEKISDVDVVDAFRALLEHSLKIHLRSDVPVGVNLSSGVDSVSLFSVLKKIGGLHSLTAFSMGFQEPAYDETTDIADLAQGEKMKFVRAEIHPEDHFKYLRASLAALDQPFGGLSTVGYVKLMEAAKQEGVTVLLEGQGVDEMLAGYEYYKTESGPGTFQDATKFIRAECLRPGWVRRVEAEGLPSFPAPFPSRLSNALYRDLMFTKLPRVLRFNDHASMAYSRELRVPYLDHRLVEFCFNLPDRWKLRGGQTKYLLREAVRGLVPEALRVRGKRPQSSPQTAWYKTALRERIRAELNDERVQKLPFVDGPSALSAFDRFTRDDADKNSFFFWQIINLGYWYHGA